jgi:hypothetical protein
LVAKRRTKVRIDAGHLGDLRPGKYDGDTGKFFGARLVNADDSSVGIGAAQNRNVQHTGHFDIAHMEHLPGDFLVCVFSENGLAYDGEICHAITPERY